MNMSTKKTPEERADERFPDDTADMTDLSKTAEFIKLVRISARDGYAAAIREVGKPIADERDELREALESAVKSIGASAISEAAKWTSDPDAQLRHMNKVTEPYRSILAKYQKP